ncbi:glycosyltransferase family 2 protein [Marimonas lutisalis]|uniref:glycosyltransferase family 2 protein n=1 Tax=Marimonas lutisalis TaxID=2545756 RepID=UPI0010F4D04B|nr:glycosyltransferase [Marimonas lutisalis]
MDSRITETSSPSQNAPRIVVGIATLGRGDIVTQAVRDIARQQRLPDLVVVSGTSDTDFGALPGENLPFPLKLLTGPKGSCAQRNLILSHLTPADILLVMDDDFLLADDYLRELEALMHDAPDIVIATGHVLVDGILGPGLDFDEGKAALEKGLERPAQHDITPVRNGYGCNMAVRMKPVLEHELQFDEALPLYGWFEDVDFSVRVGQHGRVVRADMLRGVHLGTKTGRTPGKKFGYSQVANLLYLRRKGTITRKALWYRMSRNVASNLRYSLLPVDWADHRGRLLGNLLAFIDLVRGRCTPSRITRL